MQATSWSQYFLFVTHFMYFTKGSLKFLVFQYKLLKANQESLVAPDA